MRLNSGTATPILCINVPQFHLLLYLFRKSNTHHDEVFFSLHPDQDKIVFLQTEYTARGKKKKICHISTSFHEKKQQYKHQVDCYQLYLPPVTIVF